METIKLESGTDFYCNYRVFCIPLCTAKPGGVSLCVLTYAFTLVLAYSLGSPPLLQRGKGLVKTIHKSCAAALHRVCPIRLQCISLVTNRYLLRRRVSRPENGDFQSSIATVVGVENI